MSPEILATQPETPRADFTVTGFHKLTNQILTTTFPAVTIEGEVASFKTNQNRYVFFDLKDEESSLSCFMWLSQLNLPLEDGMKVVVRARPSLTKWGKFSLTVDRIVPVGEGNLKKAFELLKAKLTKEGLFDPAKKRPLPDKIVNIGVISSTSAAGYADFVKILNERWGGLKLKVAHTKVQGLDAPDQIIRALNYLNQSENLDVIAILRGGGSADDLAAFNDEQLARAIATSRTPVITGIGHEIDESLADLAADVRASTPSNAAQMLTKDRHAEIHRLRQSVTGARNYLVQNLATTYRQLAPSTLSRDLKTRLDHLTETIRDKRKLIESFNPDLVLKQGYAILSGNLSKGSVVKITTIDKLITTEVKNVQTRKP